MDYAERITKAGFILNWTTWFSSEQHLFAVFGVFQFELMDIIPLNLIILSGIMQSGI
jgi:hypothetical protein